MSNESARGLAPERRLGARHAELQGAPLRELRFRLPRHLASDLKNIALTCTVQGPEGSVFAVPVLDYSELGLGVATSTHLVVRAGDVLEQVEVRAHDRPVYGGQARVVHDPKRPDRLGLALLGAPLSVATIEMEERRASETALVVHHLDAVNDLLDPNGIPLAYRAAAADLRLSLESIGDQLESLVREPGIDPTAILDRIEEAVAPQFLRLVTTLDDSMRGASEDVEEVSTAYARWFLHPLLLHGTVAARAFEKPLGYAGDYVLMNQIYQRSDDAPTLLGRLLDRLCYRLPGTKATRARIPLLARILHADLSARRGTVRIASFASGPAEELALLTELPSIPDVFPDVTLVDQDAEALAFAQRRFLRLPAQGEVSSNFTFNYIRTAVKTVIVEPEKLEPLFGAFDVIYSVGLFDYLPDPVARSLGSNLAKFLAPGGLLLIGNFTHHDAETFVEHLLDWRLLYRDAEALGKLAASIANASSFVFEHSVVSEPNGLYLLLQMRRGLAATGA